MSTHVRRRASNNVDELFCENIKNIRKMQCLFDYTRRQCLSQKHCVRCLSFRHLSVLGHLCVAYAFRACERSELSPKVFSDLVFPKVEHEMIDQKR
jgi:hypothetical protein